MKEIGFGSAAIGRPQYINIRQHQSEPLDLESFRAQGLWTLDSAYEQGIRYFDTAPGYGMAEQLLIDWARAKGDPAIEIATKWGYTYVANFDPQAKIHEVKDHSLSKLTEQWEKSKDLLPYLSTLQVHSATFQSGILENQAVLEKLAELEGLHDIRIGVTTTGSNQLEVLKYAANIVVDDLSLFDVYQVTYNILDQSLLNTIIELVNSDKRVVIKEALANGRLFRNDRYPQFQNLYDTLEKIANKYQVGVDAVAIRFCIDTVNPYSVLSGASEAPQIEQNLKAQTFKLSDEELTILKSFKQDPDLYWSERKQLSWN